MASASAALLPATLSKRPMLQLQTDHRAGERLACDSRTQTVGASTPVTGLVGSNFVTDHESIPKAVYVRPGRNDQSRTFDKDNFCRRAMAICFRGPEEREVMLISSSSDRNKWILPGGGIDPGELAADCCLREALEEAGVKGVLQRFVGVFESLCGRTPSRTAAMVMYVDTMLDSWQEKGQYGRQRRWVSPEEAVQMLTSKPYQVEALLAAMRKD